MLVCLLCGANSGSAMPSPLHSAHVEAHESIIPSLWRLLLLGRGGCRKCQSFFSSSSCPVAPWAQICQLRNPIYSPSVPVVCRNNWLCLFELVFIQGRKTFVYNRILFSRLDVSNLNLLQEGRAMGNSNGISAPDHTPGSILGPDASATIISLRVGVCWKLLLAAFLLEKSSQKTVSVEWHLHCLGRGSSVACCTWSGVEYLQCVGMMLLGDVSGSSACRWIYDGIIDAVSTRANKGILSSGSAYPALGVRLEKTLKSLLRSVEGKRYCGCCGFGV